MFHTILAAALAGFAPPVPPFTLHVQREARPICVIPADDTDDFVDAAQRHADRRREAVVVCQDGRFVCVVNPRK